MFRCIIPPFKPVKQPAGTTAHTPCPVSKNLLLDNSTSKDSEIMKIISTIVIIAAFITLIFCSGCISQQTVQSPGTQGVTIPETPVTSVTSLPATLPVLTTKSIPEPAEQTVIDTLPQNVTALSPANAVDVGIEKDRVYNTITVTFIGGPGQVIVKNILVRVTTSDGRVEQKNIQIGNQVSTGASVDMKGTRGSDRVEVFVTLGGVIYKLKDENMTYAYY